MTTPPPSGSSSDQTTTYAYDLDGNEVEMTVPPTSGSGTGQTTGYTYDGGDRESSSEVGSETTTTFYDAEGNEVAVTDPDGYADLTYDLSLGGPCNPLSETGCPYTTYYTYPIGAKALDSPFAAGKVNVVSRLIPKSDTDEEAEALAVYATGAQTLDSNGYGYPIGFSETIRSSAGEKLWSTLVPGYYSYSYAGVLAEKAQGDYQALYPASGVDEGANLSQEWGLLIALPVTQAEATADDISLGEAELAVAA